MNWLDQYEIKARIAPAIIISLPLAISSIVIALTVSDKFAQLVISSGFVFVVFSYGLSFLIRYYGREIETSLWASWDGPPSTRIMRWGDSTLGENIKQQLHEAVENCCGIELSSKDQESNDRSKADAQIEQAFLQVKAIVRQDDPEGIWAKHSAEYGFHRNLLGSRRIWLIFSIIGVIICGITLYFEKDNILILGAIINILLTTISIVSGWHYLPTIIKITADRYAESVWISFLVHSKRSPK